MTDRPILFSGPMVRALIDGRNAQTRRVLHDGYVYDDISSEMLEDLELRGSPLVWSRGETLNAARVPFDVGDRLYVREAWHAARSLDKTAPRDIPHDADVEHACTARSYAEIGLKGRLRPGIYMPRWASRLTLVVTEVRVERLQEISEADAKAEGAAYGYSHPADPDEASPLSQRRMFNLLWDSLNAKRGYGWDVNPWVVAVSFDVVRGNIDATPRSLAAGGRS